jgi:hypothetical protein
MSGRREALVSTIEKRYYLIFSLVKTSGYINRLSV